MSQLDALQLFVQQRLSAATEDIFSRVSRTIREYEAEVLRLKQEVERRDRLLEDRLLEDRQLEDRQLEDRLLEDRQLEDRLLEDRLLEDRPAGVLQVFTTEEEQQLRGRSVSPHIKQEESGASGPETHTEFTQSPEWLKKRPETDQSASSNQIRPCRKEAGPQLAVNKQEVVSVKQEVNEGYMMLEAAVRAEISSQQEGVLQIFTTEEEQQVRGPSLTLHIKQEDRASGPQFTQSPDWLMKGYEDDNSSSSSQIQSHRNQDLLSPQSDHGQTCLPTDHLRDSVVQSESSTEDSDDAQLDPGLQGTRGPEARPPVDQNLLVCSSCGRGFSSTRTLRKHIRRNTSQDQDQMSCSRRRQRAPFQCPTKSFSCRICGTAFYTQGILVRHAENHCKEPESRCGACGDRLESTNVLRDHLRSHKELGSTCDVCGKKCSSMKRMEIHRRVHTGEKPYHCGFCSRDFSRKESLDRHLNVHSGDRPHCCGLCRRTFTRREYLVHHLNTGHPERLGPPAGTVETTGPPAGTVQRPGPPAGTVQRLGPPAGAVRRPGPLAGAVERTSPPTGTIQRLSPPAGTVQTTVPSTGPH